MSSTMYVKGYQKADETWKRMKEIWDLCNQQKIEPPKEVYNYFDGYYPDDAPGKEVDLDSVCAEYNGTYEYGFEIKVSDIPKHVTHIRFLRG